MRKLTHYVAPPLPIQPAAAGLGWGPQIYSITLRLGLQCSLFPDPRPKDVTAQFTSGALVRDGLVPLRRALRPGTTGIQKQCAIAYKRLDVPADWCPAALIFAITGTCPITTHRFQYSELQRQRRKDAGSVRKNNRAGQEKKAAYRGKAGAGAAAPGIFGNFPSLESSAPQA